MAKGPKIAIVGRPNVGKSALFNCICNKRIAIVDEKEGVTRDRIYSDTEIFGFEFQVIDTGGIDAKSDAPFNEEIKRQAEIAIEEADALVMVVDSRVGPTALDHEVAKILHRTKKPVYVAVNKVDRLDQEQESLSLFYSLGLPKMIAVSACQRHNIAELMEAATETFSRETVDNENDPSFKIAIVGRPNVGKSSLTNKLLNEKRCIVSPIPGTTVDSIDTPLLYEGQPITLIDTAGIRKKKGEHEVVDKFAAIRTERAIERADLCLLMLDVTEGMTTQDKRIARSIEESGKSCVILFNKWDLVKGFRMEHCLKNIEEDVPFLKHCPQIMVSAKEGRNLDKAIQAAFEVHEESKKRVTTHQLNTFIERSMQKNHPPMINGKRLRIYYAAQVGIEPPKFVLFINYKDRLGKGYQRYLLNRLRDTFKFTGCPVQFYFKEKKGKKQEEALLS